MHFKNSSTIAWHRTKDHEYKLQKLKGTTRLWRIWGGIVDGNENLQFVVKVPQHYTMQAPFITSTQVREQGPIRPEDLFIPFDKFPWYQSLRNRCIDGCATLLCGAYQSGKTSAVHQIIREMSDKCTTIYLDMLTQCSEGYDIYDIVTCHESHEHVDRFLRYLLSQTKIKARSSSLVTVSSFVQALCHNLDSDSRGYAFIFDEYDAFNTFLIKNNSPLRSTIETLMAYNLNVPGTQRPIKFIVAVGSSLLDSRASISYALSSPSMDISSAMESSCDNSIESAVSDDSLRKLLLACGSPFNKADRISTEPPTTNAAHEYIRRYFSGRGLQIDTDVCNEITHMSGSSLGILNFLMRVLATDTEAHCDINQWIVATGRGRLQQKLMRAVSIHTIIDRLKPVLAPNGSRRIHTILTELFRQGEFQVPKVNPSNLQAACSYLIALGVLAPISIGSDVYHLWPPAMKAIILSELYPLLSGDLELVDPPRIHEPIYSNAWLQHIALFCARHMRQDRAMNESGISEYTIQGEWWLQLTRCLSTVRKAKVIQEAFVTSRDHHCNIWIEDDDHAVGIEFKVDESAMSTHYPQLYKYATLLKPSQMLLVNVITTGPFTLPFSPPNNTPCTQLDAMVIKIITNSDGTFNCSMHIQMI